MNATVLKRPVTKMYLFDRLIHVVGLSRSTGSPTHSRDSGIDVFLIVVEHIAEATSFLFLVFECSISRGVSVHLLHIARSPQFHSSANGN